MTRPAPPPRVARLRHAALPHLLAALWFAVPAQAWLAAHAGMGWELVSMLGALAAGSASLAAAGGQPNHRQRLVIALALAAAAALLAGAAHGTPAAPALRALPPVVLLLACLLGDARAVLAAALVLATLELAPLLAAAAPLPALARCTLLLAIGAALSLALRRLGRPARPRVEVFAPSRPSPRPSPRPARVPTPPPAASSPGVLVQVERAPSGALRLAVAVPAGQQGVTRIRVAPT